MKTRPIGLEPISHEQSISPGSNAVVSIEDRPILEGGKDFGSLSSYKGIPNTTSKFREDKKVNWHSPPFETRLERALNRRPVEA
ncbi:hypothetical protein Vadar_002821 [Vaccinium darrowii]|uniref:Uncharacterized protein n=1 Tax=Vaccinium darrowii TaxID=229202 RepID=A0ACB7XX55_9ERIC|nr:hypothetical protein Vadar_002821 [Vaccinium darrowii]